jgi:hypothetical protein
MALALNPDVDVAKLQAIIDMKHREEDRQAKRAYVAAMNEFRAACPQIFKTKTVDFATAKGRTHYKHAGLAEAMAQIKSALSDYDLVPSWRTQVGDGSVEVTCVVTHAEGHSETTAMVAPFDTSGNKNNIQAIGSAVTYLQRYTLFVLLGLAAADDDDSVGASEKITEAQAQKLHTDLIDTKSDEEKFLQVFGIERLEDMLARDYGRADKMLATKAARILEDVL